MSKSVVHADGLERCPWPKQDPLYVAYHDEEWGVPVTRLAKWKTTGQMVAVGFLIAGEAGDRAVSAIIHGAPPVVTEIGILLLWLSAILTLYTGWDYMRAGLQYMVDE